MEQEASRISKSPRQGQILTLPISPQCPQQHYDSNIIIFLTLQTRKLTHGAFNNVSQITQLVSTRAGICTLVQFSLSPIALDICVSLKCIQPITTIRCIGTVKNKTPAPHLRLTELESLGWWVPGIFNKLPW